MDRKKDEISERKSKLSLAKQALLEKRLRGTVESNPQLKVIPRRSQQSSVPLSFSQQRLWFLHQLDPNSAAYNEVASVHLTGTLNVAALQQSLNEIIRRHEVLRTTFGIEDGQPVQIIHSTLNFKLSVFRCESETIIDEEIKKPFDLTQAPLLRGTLLHLGEREHLLLFVMHHIVCDGWSLQVILRELATLYEAFSTGKPSPILELPIQYADFAVWQRQRSAEHLQTQLSYWKQQLANTPTGLNLPTDRPRLPIKTFPGATVNFKLSKHITEMLKCLSQGSGCTLFMTLLAAFQTLLHRYSGQDDILVGTPIANRNLSETEGLIGFFVNTLVMRTDFSGNPSFQKLLNRVRSLAVNAYANQDLPFEHLVEQLQPERNLSHQPLFQVMFVFQDDPIEDLILPGLTISRQPIDNKTAKFDLTLYLVDSESGLSGLFEYNTDLFDADTINRMVGHFSTLLEGIIADSERPISEVPLLTAIEQHQLLVEWNNTAVDYPVDKCLHDLFEEQVKRSPDAIAVVFEQQKLTYRELNYRADVIARHLELLGVKPDVLVGICVERSLFMIVGLLAILKAGGAYVPLDPDYPKERLAFMLEDARVSVLLTQKHLLEIIPKNQALLVLLNEDIRAEFPMPDARSPKPDSSSLAYCIYTSGSTGLPKAAMNTHQGICNRLLWMQQTYQLTSSDRVLQKTPFSFDVSVWEFFWPLIVGATLVIARPQGHKDSGYLVKLIAREKITTVHFVPSMLQVFLEEENLEECNCLQRVICSGEALPLALQQRFFAKLQGSLHNLYGPTETAVDVTYWRSKKESDLQIVPIGRAIANTQLYILDKHLHPVPIGVAGELHIGGTGLGRGYLNRPSLTAEKFIPNPFSNQPGKRLYKTGDLARYLPDGNIEYLGRIDYQVKIRGNRIELGEIEAVLVQHEAVREAVVLAREDEPGNKRLVAYVVSLSHSQIPLSDTLLRSFLKEKLPDYMMPATFVVLNELPLTLNGKIDRKALPIPDLATAQSKTTFVPPSTPIEEMLSGIWARLLGVEQVGIRDNFFELGGHSLLATQVISQIRQTFRVEIPLICLFEKPTIAEIAASIETAMKAGQELVSPPIQRVPRNGELPPSFAQQRLWFLHQLASDSPAYNGCVAIHLNGVLDVAALEQSINEIISRHEALRTNFAVIEGKLVQVIHTSLTLTLPVIDLQELPEPLQQQQIQKIATENAQQSFDLSRDSLLRITLLKLAEKQHIFLLTIHHIVSDGWSTGIFIREVAALYEAFSQKQFSPLTELPVQYADFAVWQREWMQGEVLQTQLAYWKQRLSVNLPVLKLSDAAQTNSNPSPLQAFTGKKQTFELPASLTQALKILSQREGVTLFMTLLAAFKTLLHYYTKQEDILVGSPIANRNRSEIENLIGFFVNTLILRTDLSNNPSFREILQRVREVALGAYAHQDLPFEQLVAELQPERTLTHNPLFQVWFVLQASMPMELPGLTLDIEEVDSGMVRHDLKLDLTETPAEIRGFFEYKTALFDAATIAQMVEMFKTLLHAVAEQPDMNLSQITAILTETNRQQQLAKQKEFKAARSQKLGNIQRRSISETWIKP